MNIIPTSLILGAFAGLLIYTGCRVLIGGKPVIQSGLTLFTMIMIMFAAQFFQAWSISDFEFDLRNAAMLAIYVLLSIVFYLQCRGYAILGVSGKRLREALLFSLSKNNIPFEERLSSVVLRKNEDCELKVASWASGSWIRLTNDRDGSLMPKILNGIRQDFADKPGQIDPFFAILQLILGAVLVTMVAVLNFGFN